MLFSLSSVPGCASPGPSHASLTMTAVLWPLAKALPPVHTRRCGWVSALAPRPHLGQGLNGASGPWKEQLPEPLDSRTFRFLQIGLLVGTPGSVSSLGSCVCCGTTLGKIPHLGIVCVLRDHAGEGSPSFSCPHSSGVLSPTSTPFFHPCRLYHLPHPTLYGRLFEFNTLCLHI